MVPTGLTSYRRWLRTASWALALVAVVAFGTWPAAAKKVQLTFWSWGDPQEVKTNQTLVDRFNKLNPDIEVTYVPVPQDYATKFETAVAAGAAPDVFYVLEPSYVRWASQGLLLDLLPYLRRMGIDPAKKWHPQAQWWYKGGYYGTSIALETMIIFYNADLFKQAGVAEPPTRPEAAWTWDEFVAAARKLTRDVRGRRPGEPGFDPRRVDVWGILYPRWYGGYMSFLFQTDALPFGENFDRFNLTDPAVTGPIQALADPATKEHVAPLPTDLTGTTANTLFATGKIAMLIDGQWALQTLTAEPLPFQLKVAVLPRYGRKFQTTVFGAPMGVYAKTKYPEEAVRFATWMLDPENVLLNMATGLWMPTEYEWLRGPRLKDWVDAYPEHHPPGYVEAAIGSLDHSKELDYKRWGGFYEAWIQVITPALDLVWNGEKTAAEALAGTRSEIERLLREH